MALGILQNGIVHRHDNGTTTVYRPGKNGGEGTEIEVPEELAHTYRLATGDVVEGEAEPIVWESEESEEEAEPEMWEEQFDEPSERRYGFAKRRASRLVATEQLTTITRINGLSLGEAEERPFPRTRRSNTERVPPERWLPIAVGRDDETGRMLDFAAPLGAGCLGVVWGEHGTGLTRTLRVIVNGITTNAPDCVVLVLLLRARSEEITDWRRRFPQAEVVVCPSAQHDQTPEQTLRVATLVWEAAQRQTELGRDVILLVDSLTGLWGTMLEAEEADAQAEADVSHARQQMREWVQKAGCFHGETPLGGSLGGSLTLIGTVWHQPVDIEAEEERDLHPHLRLLEHLLPETSWRVVLSDELARQRLFPAIEVKECLSLHEAHFLPAELLDTLLSARGTLPRNAPEYCYRSLLPAIDKTTDLKTLCETLVEASV